jgi:hypothetical protein
VAERRTEFALVVPPEHEGGVYANFLNVWFTANEFTLDFAAAQQSQLADPDDPDSAVVRYRVVSRVRVAVTMVFEMLRTLSQKMTEYENDFGEIRRPGE